MTNALSGERKHRKLERLLEFCGGDICFYCGIDLVEGGAHRRLRTYDHVLPLSEGGGNAVWNLVLACGHCNHRKGSMLIEPFLREVLKLRPKKIAAKLAALELREQQLRRRKRGARRPSKRAA